MVKASGILVHEWIEKTGGAENVLDQFARAFPRAPIHCLWDDSEGRYRGRTVIESPIARTPLRHHKALAAPVMPTVWQAHPTLPSHIDWMLVSTHAFAHHVVSSRAARHVRSLAYVHTPARYVWAPEYDPRGRARSARIAAPLLRRIDRTRAAHINEIAANSEFVRERIGKAWGRNARVIYPPVAVEELQAVPDWRNSVREDSERAMLDSLPDGFILGASRMVEYKQLDVVIYAGEAAGIPVVIAGDGPDNERLRAVASAVRVPVLFAGRVSDAMLRALMQSALAYVFPPIEDFGIMPVEAMALGTPVVVNATGGASESLRALGLGVTFNSMDAASLNEAVLKAIEIPAGSKPLRAQQMFGQNRFRQQVQAWVSE